MLPGENRPPGRLRASSVRTMAVPEADGRIPRPRLLTRLEALTGPAALLLNAPAGYGKTTLLASWAAVQPLPVAWLSLNTDHNDDVAFGSSLLAALRSCPAVPAGSPLHRISLPEYPDLRSGFTEQLFDAAASLPAPLLLVLDGLHEVTAPGPLKSVTALAQDMPATLRLVLSTRASPQLPLARMRAAGTLAELPAAELLFTAEETVHAAAALGVRLSPEQLAAMQAQTAGWPAVTGLALRQLARLPHPRKRPDWPGNLAASREIADYLQHEVVAGLTAEEARLLSCCSVCGQVGSLQAVQLSGMADAGDVLAAIENRTALVSSSGPGRQLFSIQPMLRDHLRNELQRRRPLEAAEVHSRAVWWHEQAGEPTAAVAHARLAQDRRQLADLLRRHGFWLLHRGEVAAVGQGLETLGQDYLLADARLCLAAAGVKLERRQPAASRFYLEVAERRWPPDADRNLDMVRDLLKSRLAWYLDVGTAGAAAPAVDALDALDLQECALLQESAAALVRADHAAAARTAAEAATRAAAQGNSHLQAQSLLRLAAAAALQGRIGQAADLAGRAHVLAPPAAWAAGPGVVFTTLLRAFEALLQCRPDECLQLAESIAGAASQLARPSPGRAIAALRPALDFVRAAARFDLGDRHGGLEAMAGARRHLTGENGIELRVAAWTSIVEYGAAAAWGSGGHAREVLDWSEARLAGTGELCLLRALHCAQKGQFAAARDQLRPARKGRAAPVLAWTRIHIDVLECSMLLRTGVRARAALCLRHALKGTAELGILRPLVVAPAEVLDLLSDLMGTWEAQEMLARRLLALGRLSGSGAGTDLTRRELEVLALLPTRLSLKEIAAELSVTVNTIKTHVRNIYAKLGTSTRRQTVNEAYRNGVLTAHS